jgi:phosphoserine phosphatase
MNDARETLDAGGVPAVDYRKHVADLQAVLEVSRQLSATDDLVHLVQAVERAACLVLECERATLLLYDRKSRTLSRPEEADGEARRGVQRKLALEAVSTGRRVEVDDPASDPRFDAEAGGRAGIPIRNLTCQPLLDYEQNIVGVLQVENAPPRDPWDDELVKVFDAQVGVAVQRQLLLEHFAEKRRIEQDLKLARSIQQGLLPARNPVVDGFDIAGWNEPADATGGDFWDYHRLPDGTLALALADATGHGIGAALMMAICRSLCRATTSMSRDLREIVDRVNRLLHDDLADNRSVTAVLGILDGDTLSFLSAGHGPLLRYVAAEGAFRLQAAHGIPLGIFPDYPWPAPERFTMASGDLMVLLTDGFFEWEDETGEPFGMERIREVLREDLDRPAAEMIAAMHDAVRRFANGTPQIDDLTALVIRKL